MIRRTPFIRATAQLAVAIALAVIPVAGAQVDAAAGTDPMSGGVVALPWVDAGELGAFLGAVASHPALQAARAARRASEADAAAARSPFDIGASYTKAWLFYDDDVQAPPGTELPTQGQRVSVDASFRPFPFGDLRDLTDQRDLELARSDLSLRQAQAQLEAQAIESAGGVLIAERGLALADAGVDLARSGLEITQLRASRGGATDAELARAEQDLARAEQQRDAAARRLGLSRAALAQLVGDASLSGLPDPSDLPPVGGPAADVQSAQIDARLAEIGARSSSRDFWPIAQASVSAPFGPDGGTIGASIESRTLQPTLNYTYNEGAAALDGGGSSDPVRLQISVSVDLSPETFARNDAAQARLEAARAALESARTQAEIAAMQSDADLAAARQALTLAQTDLQLAQSAEADAAERRDLGLATDLDVRRAELDVSSAELDVARAQLDLVSAVLATYRAAALPPSEALP